MSAMRGGWHPDLPDGAEHIPVNGKRRRVVDSRRVKAMERVVEAARAVVPKYLPLIEGFHVGAKPSSRDMHALADALAELDGQEEGGPSQAVEPHGGARQACEPSDRAVPPSSCPCRVHGDPDGDCGETCA